MDKAELIRKLAEIVDGLQVPVSLKVPIGTADLPAREIMGAVGFGWKNVDDFEGFFKKVLEE
jgi:hypothetical protein